MAARDKYHDAVKKALVEEGWTITHDPYRIAIGRRRGYILVFFDPRQERISEWIEVIPIEPS